MNHDICIFEFDSIDSTNLEARRKIASRDFTKFPALIMSREQSAGRGRLGRTFYSPKDSGLYMSLVLKTTLSPSDMLKLTPAAAVAVREEIADMTGRSCMIKWVNDVYLNGGKLCGILCESTEFDGENHIIIGIGINLTTKDFPDGLRAPAASLFEDGRTITDDLTRTLALNISNRILDIAIGGFKTCECLDIYRKYSYLDGKDVELSCGVGGTVLGINDDFSLSVKTSDGEIKAVSSGEAL